MDGGQLTLRSKVARVADPNRNRPGAFIRRKTIEDLVNPIGDMFNGNGGPFGERLFPAKPDIAPQGHEAKPVPRASQLDYQEIGSVRIESQDLGFTSTGRVQFPERLHHPEVD